MLGTASARIQVRPSIDRFIPNAHIVELTLIVYCMWLYSKEREREKKRKKVRQQENDNKQKHH